MFVHGDGKLYAILNDKYAKSFIRRVGYHVSAGIFFFTTAIRCIFNWISATN